MAKSKAKAKSNKKAKKKEDSDDEPLSGNEYFVEKVLKAKVNVVRKDGVHWTYLTKWKGYDDPSEDTWEPSHSFKDSEQFIDEFWKNADLKGRDHESPSDWLRGDTVRRLAETRRSSARNKAQSESSAQGEESEVEVILDQEKQESEPSSSPPPPPERGRAPRQTVLSLNRKSTRGKPSVSKSKSPQRKPSSAGSRKKRKASEEIDESSSEDDDDEPPKPAPALPVKIGPPGRKKRQLKKRFTGPEHPPTPTHDPPHQDPETHTTENETTHTPKGGPTPVIAGSPVRREVQTGQFSSLSREALSPSDIPNPPDQSDKATSATPPPHVRVPKTPQHRRRAANPRVRPMDIDELPDAPAEKVDHMDHAISAKAKFAGGGRKSSSEPSTNKPKSTKRKKPGPGRSSHGIASSQDDTLVNDENPLPPATDIDEGMEEGDEDRAPSQGGEITRRELMDMVGLKENEVDNLPDFNDEPMDVETEVVQTTVTEITVESVEVSTANEERPITKPNLFARPSIFGPLSIGAGSSRNLDRNAYALRLDSSVDASVVLQDIKAGSGSGPVTSLDLKEIFSKTPSSAPGKFYDSEAGSVLLGTLKTGGPCARVELMPGEDEEHEQNWEKFRDRLESKHTFVIGAGLSLLILVASSNVEACKTMGIPDILTGLRREVIVSATDIEDVSRYSDAVDMVDDSRWL